ncbi:MAG: hypothetical protein EBZ05_01395 [Verrucomicrobia bacterium]|nr:hypothetical protein [Verrucomicrobiota bacterium]NDA25498.1 hypothetical protein [Verrucomicrobiota bacterium]
MPAITLGFSVAYIVLGLAAFFLTGATHQTALIPAYIGLLLSLLAWLGQKENLRKHVMHAAMLIGLLALFGTVRSLLKLPAAFDGTAERPAAIYAQAATALLSVAYLGLGVRSFIQARRSRSS